MEQQIHMGINKRALKLASVVCLSSGHPNRAQEQRPAFLSPIPFYLNTDRNPQAEDILTSNLNTCPAGGQKEGCGEAATPVSLRDLPAGEGWGLRRGSLRNHQGASAGVALPGARGRVGRKSCRRPGACVRSCPAAGLCCPSETLTAGQAAWSEGGPHWGGHEADGATRHTQRARSPWCPRSTWQEQEEDRKKREGPGHRCCRCWICWLSQ